LEDRVIVWNKRRGAVPAGFSGVYVGRPSVLGNPFRVSAALPQGKAAAAYGPYLDKHLSEDGEIALEIERLALRVRAGEKIAVICWCSPLPCHGDHIRSAVLRAAKEV